MNIIKQIIPKELASYTNISFKPKYITIHEAELGINDVEKYKDVSYYYNMLLNPKKDREKVGYHYIVDDKGVYEFIEPTIVAYHCGNKYGNHNSIGIERCVNEGINHIEAINLQAELTALLMKNFNIPIENVTTHKYWSLKECPNRLLNNVPFSFEKFLSLVNDYYERMK